MPLIAVKSTIKLNSSMDAQQTILRPFNPNEHALLELLCDEVNPDILWFIAEADYGSGSEAYLQVLERIKREKRIPKIPFDTALSEVVELTRWEQPKMETNWSDERVGKVNLAVAFSCTILLTVPSECYYNRDGEHYAVIRLLQASRVLSGDLPDIWERVGALLAWRITENETSPDERLFFLYGLLLCGLLGKLATESELLVLVNYLLEEEDKYRANLQPDKYLPVGEQWLLGLTHFSQLHDDWIDTARWLKRESAGIQLTELRKRLLQIAAWLRKPPV